MRNNFLRYNCFRDVTTAGQLVNRLFLFHYMVQPLIDVLSAIVPLQQMPFLCIENRIENGRIDGYKINCFLIMTDNGAIFSYLKKYSLKQCFRDSQINYAENTKLGNINIGVLKEFISSPTIYENKRLLRFAGAISICSIDIC